MKLNRIKLKRALPAIFTVTACIGTVATAVLAAKAGAKAADILPKLERYNGGPLTTMEKVKAVGPIFIPTAVAGAITIAAEATGLHTARQLHKEAALATMGMYTALEQRYKDHRQEEYKVLPEVQDAKVTNVHIPGLVNNDVTNDEIVLWCDAFSGEMFHSTKSQVLEAEYHFNRNFVLRGCALVTEFYEFLGIEPKKLSEEERKTLGWEMEPGFDWIDFQHFKATTDDGIECFIIEFAIDPTPQFEY